MITRLSNNRLIILTEAIKGYKKVHKLDELALTVIYDGGVVELIYEHNMDMLNDIATLELILKEKE